jgi:hypothetical protein
LDVVDVDYAIGTGSSEVFACGIVGEMFDWLWVFSKDNNLLHVMPVDDLDFELADRG